MNRLSAAILVFFLGTTALIAQANPMIDGLIDPLTQDLNALAGSICDDISPELIQPALAGDMVGAAAFDGAFPHGTVILPSIGVTLGNGLATVLNDGARDWKFVTPIPKMIQSGLSGGGAAADYYNLTRKLFPYPSSSTGLGFGITRDFEFLVSGMYLPQGLTGSFVGAANSSTVSGLNPQFSTGHLLIKARKVFFRDSKTMPAMSVSLGTAFGGSTLGVNIDLKTLLNKEVDLSGIGTLNLTGPVTFNTQSFAFGMDFAVSKQFLIFVPFARTGVWYAHSEASSKFDLSAGFTTTDTAGVKTVTPKQILVSASKTRDSIAARLGGGVEFRLGPIVYHVSADLDLSDPLIDIAGAAYEGLTLQSGFRVAF